MTPSKLSNPQMLYELSEQLRKQRDTKNAVIYLCAGTGCQTCGCKAVLATFRSEIAKEKKGGAVEIRTTGCHGFCEHGPLVIVEPQGILYQRVTAEDVRPIIEQTVNKGQVIDRLVYCDPVSGTPIPHKKDIPFFAKQSRFVLVKNGLVDPTSIEDYLALGGYQAVAKAFGSLGAEAVVAEIKKSGLKGKEGGRSLTGDRWAACRAAKGDTKYVIANADQDGSGAFIDRALCEGNPHAVLEGMIIGAFAIGAHEGFIYIADAHSQTAENLNSAIEAARQFGLLGEKILGTAFGFDISLSAGGGAFALGESSALTASLEGKISEPRARYIHTAEEGLWEKPTNLDSVETWANVPLIIEKGSAWYSGIGTKNSKGTKIFALTGSVTTGGLVEMPLGTTLRQIIFDIGSGPVKGKKFKAAYVGNLAQGSLIAGGDNSDQSQLLDKSIDFEEMSQRGVLFGAGGITVMDEDACMVDVAKHTLDCLKEESCGKCVPCREGISVMRDILQKIVSGKGNMEDLERLEELSRVLIDTSLCQLGANAPYPVLAAIHHFRQEYLAHIQNKTCPAGVCRELTSQAVA